MFTNNLKKQNELELVYIENLVPKDHILRQIDKYIDFSFIRNLTKDLYCPDNGRPSVDPVVLFKMLFIGYLFGIRSERQLVKEIEVNVAYRWFLGYSLTDKKLVDGKMLYTDSTHLKANANKNKFTKEIITQSTKDYFQELEKDINKDRVDHGKEPLKKGNNSRD